MKCTETFNVTYKNNNYQISKLDIKFTHGYGIGEIKLENPLRIKWGNKFNYGTQIKGVIDSNYQTVLEFNDYQQIHILPNGNIMAKVIHNNEPSIIEYQHYKLINKAFKKISTFHANCFKIISHDTLKISFDEFDILYNLTKGKYVSDQFTTIESFESKANFPEKLALAVYETPYCDIDCYIDINGKIRTPLFISESNVQINTKEKDFDFLGTVEAIETLMEELLEYDIELDDLIKTLNEGEKIMENNKDLLNNSDFEEINNSIIILKEENYEVLYDEDEEQILSERFSKIGRFEYTNENEDELAEAILNLTCNDITCEVICFINKCGDISSPLYVPEFGLQIIYEENFQECLEIIEELITNQTNEISVSNKLTR